MIEQDSFDAQAIGDVVEGAFTMAPLVPLTSSHLPGSLQPKYGIQHADPGAGHRIAGERAGHVAVPVERGAVRQAGQRRAGSEAALQRCGYGRGNRSQYNFGMQTLKNFGWTP